MAHAGAGTDSARRPQRASARCWAIATSRTSSATSTRRRRTGRSDGVSPETMIGSLGVALFVILEGAWAVVAAVALGRRLLGCGRTA